MLSFFVEICFVRISKLTSFGKTNHCFKEGLKTFARFLWSLLNSHERVFSLLNTSTQAIRIKQSCTARKFLVTCIDQSELIFSKAVQLLKHTAELIFNKAAELIQHDCIILLHCVDFNKCTALLRN